MTKQPIVGLGVPFSPPCNQHHDPAASEARLTRIRDPKVKALNELVDALRKERSDMSIPYVDPDSGGVDARVLVLKQDPGKKALPTGGSGMLSWANDDPTASTFCQLSGEVGLPWAALVPWNAVPWAAQGSPGEKAEGRRALIRFLALLPEVDAALLHGTKAQDAWTISVREHPALSQIKRFDTFHTSALGITNGSRQPGEVGRAHVKAKFRAVVEHLSR